jgi:dTDP-4-amino-4,6-dideoxygalactose transaminase
VTKNSNSKIPLLRPFFDSDEMEEIQKVLESGWVSQGPKVKEFEKKVADYLGVRYAIACVNCTSALHMSLLSLDIKQKDEILVADYTFPATGHSVLYCGAKPVFVDVDLRTYNINSELIEGKITERTKAIIPVHIFGQPAEMDRIKEISEKHDIKVIEDAACAFGAQYNGRYAGTIGDIGCFSFHARKGITTGEGGMLVTNNEELAKRIRELSLFGMRNAWDVERTNESVIPEFVNIGYNYKMSDITAAVGVAQLKKLEKITKRKIELAKYWDEKLQDIKDIEAPFVKENVKHIFQSYVTLLSPNIKRNRIIQELKQKGVQTQIGTYSSHIQPVYNSKEKCPNSLEIFNRSLALPMYYMLNEESIDIAAKYIKTALERLK